VDEKTQRPLYSYFGGKSEMICLDPSTKKFYSLGYQSPPWNKEGPYEEWGSEDFTFFANEITKEEASYLCLNSQDFVRICPLEEAIAWHKE